MIQLATASDPNANRMGFRPAANDGKANPFESRRRPGHPWPFISQAFGAAALIEGTTKSAGGDSAS